MSSVRQLALATFMFTLLSAAPCFAQARPIGVTARDAQDMPAQELARRVLGDAGAALVVDVDRPLFGSDPGDWAARRGQSPPSVPPALNSLTFYGRPHGAMWGMCEQLIVRVEFVGENGADTPQIPSSIETVHSFGVVESSVQPHGPFSQEYGQQLEAACAQQPVSREYFPAEGAGDASKVARVTEYLASIGAAHQTPAFQFSCEDFGRPCPDVSGLLRTLTWRGIRSVQPIPCARQQHTVRFPRCFDVVYGIAIERGHRVRTLGYVSLRVTAAFPIGPVEIESAEIERTSAVP